MKKTIPLILLISVLFFSCKEPKVTYKEIEVIAADKMAKSPDNELPKEILNLLNPIFIGDTSVLISKISIKRIDLDTSKKIDLVIPKSSLNQFRDDVGTYSYSNIIEDYNDEILNPTLKSGRFFLERKANSDFDLDTYILENKNNLLIYFLDSTKSINGNNEFSNIDSLKNYIARNAFKNKSLKVLIYPFRAAKVSPELSVMLKTLEEYISKNDFERARNISNLIVKSGVNLFNVKYFVNKIENLADNQLNSSKDCDLIITPLGYYSCAYILAESNSKTRIKNKYNSAMQYAQKHCRIVKIPSI